MEKVSPGLFEEENEVLAVSSQEVALSKQQAQFNLLFKLQTNEGLNNEVFKSILQQLWRCSHVVTIKEVRNNSFLAIFVKEENMIEVQDKSHWSFDKILILLKHFSDDLSSGNVTFQHSPFWIRVFNTHIKSMNRAIGTRIANEINTHISYG